MNLKKIAVLLSALSLGYGTAVAASDDGRYDGLEPREKFKVRIGGFLADDYDTTVRFDSRRYLIGSLIDLEEDFNVDSNESVWRLDGFYRFNERHRLSFNSYSSRRDGDAVAGREYIIGNPDRPFGHIKIPAGVQVTTKLNFDLLKVGYGYSFINRRKFEATIGAGVNFRKLDFEISYQANIANRVQGDVIGATEWVPLPTVGFGGRWNFTEKLETNIRLELFYLEFDNYEGYYQEALLNLEHRTFKHVGFGIGINYGGMNLRGKEDDIRAELDSRVLGFLGYLKFYF